MIDGEKEIIRLLTELRDAQREELAYRRRVLDDSMAKHQEGIDLARRAGYWQRVALLALPAL